MLDEHSHLSLHYQLRQILLDKLHSGAWPVGSRIPTEAELSEDYQVSRSTVRQALRELELSGLICRKQGKGTFVTRPKIEQRLTHFYSFSEEIKRMGYSVSTQVLGFDRTAGLDPCFGQDTENEYFRIHRLRLADNEPFAIETSYVPCALFAELTRDMVEKTGLYAAMQQCGSLVPDAAAEAFTAVALKTKDAQLLHTRAQAPALRLKRTTYAQEQVVEYCLSMIRGDRYEYYILLK